MHRKPKRLDNLTDKRPTLAANPLQQHTSKIEQKLSFLKQKISEKKKKSAAEKTSSVDQQLAAFMARIGLSEYLPLFAENGIDSLEILREIKQAELEEAGVLKGHALKIAVQVRKQEEKSRRASEKEEKEESRQETKPSLSQTTIQQKPATTLDQVQTESFPVSRASKSFCLYCFCRSECNFCSPNCEQLYQGMFSKYESNLQKAEESFVPRERKEEELSDNQEFLENFDFLFDPQLEDFDQQQYEDIKGLISKPA